MLRIIVINKSTRVSDQDVEAATTTVNTQLRQHVRPAWLRSAGAAFSATGHVPAEGFPLYVLDSSDQAGALGYHTEDPDGRRYARVFAAPVLDNGGTALTGELSVSSVISHEAVEAYGDLACSYWADRGDGSLTPLELCDAVESGSYAVDGVAVSNFLLPAWFDPQAPAGSKLDYLGELTRPFQLAKGGYCVVQKGGAARQVFGRSYPAWRRAGKRHPAARTQRRLRSIA